jgi:hypothetical protein
LEKKTVFLLATATGPGGGRHVVAFEQRSKSSGAILQSFYLPKFKETFDSEKGNIDEEKI